MKNFGNTNYDPYAGLRNQSSLPINAYRGMLLQNRFKNFGNIEQNINDKYNNLTKHTFPSFNDRFKSYMGNPTKPPKENIIPIDKPWYRTNEELDIKIKAMISKPKPDYGTEALKYFPKGSIFIPGRLSTYSPNGHYVGPDGKVVGIAN